MLFSSVFYIFQNEQVMVDMMQITSYFNVKYIKNPGVKVLELPYGVSQDFVMIIILPDNNSLLKRVSLTKIIVPIPNNSQHYLL